MDPQPIIDAHHHIWRLAGTPWLNGPPVPRIFGEYGRLRRDYRAAQFVADARAAGVVQSVYVQINVAVKLSGLGTFSRTCTVADWRPIVRETLALFGPERALFGSNYPIESLWTTYERIVAVMRECIADRTGTEQCAILHDNARRVYRL